MAGAVAVERVIPTKQEMEGGEGWGCIVLPHQCRHPNKLELWNKSDFVFPPSSHPHRTQILSLAQPYHQSTNPLAGVLD